MHTNQGGAGTQRLRRRCHLVRVDTLAGRAHTHTHTLKQAFGSHSVSQRTSEQLQEPRGGPGLTASSEGAVGGRRREGGGGLLQQGDPEPGAACLIGAHLHSSGAGDT